MHTSEKKNMKKKNKEHNVKLNYNKIHTVRYSKQKITHPLVQLSQSHTGSRYHQHNGVFAVPIVHLRCSARQNVDTTLDWFLIAETP